MHLSTLRKGIHIERDNQTIKATTTTSKIKYFALSNPFIYLLFKIIINNKTINLDLIKHIRFFFFVGPLCLARIANRIL